MNLEATGDKGNMLSLDQKYGFVFTKSPPETLNSMKETAEPGNQSDEYTPRSPINEEDDDVKFLGGHCKPKKIIVPPPEVQLPKPVPFPLTKRKAAVRTSGVSQQKDDIVYVIPKKKERMYPTIDGEAIRKRKEIRNGMPFS